MEVERCANTQHHRWNTILMRLHPSLLPGTADTYEQDTRTRGPYLLRYCFVFLGRQRTKRRCDLAHYPYSGVASFQDTNERLQQLRRATVQPDRYAFPRGSL